MGLKYYFGFSLSLPFLIGIIFMFGACSAPEETVENKPDIIKENENKVDEDTTGTISKAKEARSGQDSKDESASKKQEEDKLQLEYKNESTSVTIPLDVEKQDFVLELQGVETKPKQSRPDSVVLEDSLVQAEMSKRINEVLKYFRQAQDLFYRRDYKGAMEMIDKSLEVERTAEALGLKGSIFFMQDNISSAKYYWNRAVEMDPEVPVPDIPELEGMVEEIKTSENKENTE